MTVPRYRRTAAGLRPARSPEGLLQCRNGVFQRGGTRGVETCAQRADGLAGFLALRHGPSGEVLLERGLRLLRCLQSLVQCGDDVARPLPWHRRPVPPVVHTFGRPGWLLQRCLHCGLQCAFPLGAGLVGHLRFHLRGAAQRALAGRAAEVCQPVHVRGQFFPGRRPGLPFGGLQACRVVSGLRRRAGARAPWPRMPGRWRCIRGPCAHAVPSAPVLPGRAVLPRPRRPARAAPRTGRCRAFPAMRGCLAGPDGRAIAQALPGPAPMRSPGRRQGAPARCRWHRARLRAARGSTTRSGPGVCVWRSPRAAGRGSIRRTPPARAARAPAAVRLALPFAVLQRRPAEAAARPARGPWFCAVPRSAAGWRGLPGPRGVRAPAFTAAAGLEISDGCDRASKARAASSSAAQECAYVASHASSMASA